MKNAIFYLLDHDVYQDDDVSATEQLACEITAVRWRHGKRILIVCADKQQAIHLNELLWMRPERSFIPHNLSNEGPSNGTPVEISWSKKYNNGMQDVLINLDYKFIDFCVAFEEVIDFVPHEKCLKQLARERYKAYRLAAFNIKTAIWKYGKKI